MWRRIPGLVKVGIFLFGGWLVLRFATRKNREMAR